MSLFMTTRGVEGKGKALVHCDHGFIKEIGLTTCAVLIAELEVLLSPHYWRKEAEAEILSRWSRN